MASAQVQNSTNPKTQPQNGAQVTLTNQTLAEMKLNSAIDWSGNVATRFPPTIAPGQSVTFSHLGDGDFGSKAAVVYNGINAVGLQCGWLLAWDAPANTQQSPNKVYVTCGPKSVIDGLDFEQIRMYLSESESKSNAVDPATKTRVNAEIDESIPNKAKVVATFSLVR
ncbi:jasmonate-induced protein homolog [Silene latifolia]|uniref:jasmonate-induced protein homolog n=1 Tax=Silene latifolia TaxID=37657 RepID=UPI003D76FDA5